MGVDHAKQVKKWRAIRLGPLHQAAADQDFPCWWPSHAHAVRHSGPWAARGRQRAVAERRDFATEVADFASVDRPREHRGAVQSWPDVCQRPRRAAGLPRSCDLVSQSGRLGVRRSSIRITAVGCTASPTRWRRRVTAATDDGQARNAYRPTIQTPRSGRSPSPTPRRPSKNGARQSMLIAKPDASRSSWGADRRGTPAAHHTETQRACTQFFWVRMGLICSPLRVYPL
jgi:hypothetical protein